MKKVKDLRGGAPSKPVGLSERASAAWDRLVAELAASGIVPCPAHRAWLELASTIEADMVESAARVKKDGPYIETKAGLVAHPASKRLDALRRDYTKVLSLIGLRDAAAEALIRANPTLTGLKLSQLMASHQIKRSTDWCNKRKVSLGITTGAKRTEAN